MSEEIPKIGIVLGEQLVPFKKDFFDDKGIKASEIAPLDYLFGENKHPIQTDEDYRELAEVFDEDE